MIKRKGKNNTLIVRLLFVTSGMLSTQLLVAEDLAKLEQSDLKSAVAHIAPSVVRIETFGGLLQGGQISTAEAPTTGVVATEDGYIVSSAFAFVHRPESAVVTTHDDQTFPARMVARDRSRMLVLLKVDEPYAWSVPTTAPRTKLQVGQWTLAVGRTYDSELPNASAGILSALNRIWGKAIQTDAKVSPANYGGPLIDIYGRAIGVLVPLSPQAHSEIAGAEWYDGGIGFAIAWEDILQVIPQLQEGRDLHAGLIGITFDSHDLFSRKVVIASVVPNSPAAKSGLQAGDEIVAADGNDVTRQAQLKHVLGPKYAGEPLRLTVRRGEEKIDVDLELAERIDPYQAPFLGVLPERDSDIARAGVSIRYVYPGSPAADLGLQVGDVLVQCNSQVLNSIEQWHQSLAQWQPGDEVQIKYQRGEQSNDAAVTFTALPETMPGDLPSPQALEKPDDLKRVKITIPAAANECVAYVPAGGEPPAGYGLLVWLAPPELAGDEETLSSWKPLCQQFGLMLLCPSPRDPKKWSTAELEFLEKCIGHAKRNFNIDPSRTVVHGFQSGGVMAYLLAIQSPEHIRGVAVVDAALARGISFRANDPIHRLAMFIAADNVSRLVDRIRFNVEQLRKLKYPVTFRNFAITGRFATPAMAKEISQWVDTLDRL